MLDEWSQHQNGRSGDKDNLITKAKVMDVCPREANTDKITLETERPSSPDGAVDRYRGWNTGLAIMEDMSAAEYRDSRDLEPAEPYPSPGYNSQRLRRRKSRMI